MKKSYLSDCTDVSIASSCWYSSSKSFGNIFLNNSRLSSQLAKRHEQYKRCVFSLFPIQFIQGILSTTTLSMQIPLNFKFHFHSYSMMLISSCPFKSPWLCTLLRTSSKSLQTEALLFGRRNEIQCTWDRSNEFKSRC